MPSLLEESLIGENLSIARIRFKSLFFRLDLYLFALRSFHLNKWKKIEKTSLRYRGFEMCELRIRENRSKLKSSTLKL